MKLALAPLVILAFLGSASHVIAGERAQMLWSRGLIELHAGRDQAALDLFQQALDTDPGDIHARYYRAVARSRLGDREGAINDLQAVLAADPNFDEAALDLGVALIEEQRYPEAVPWLQQSQRSPALATRAALFLGIAQLRDKQLLAAQESFGRILNDPEYGLTARYYAGVVDYQLGNLPAAETAFTAVVQAQPDSAIGREAQRFLDLLHGTGHRWYALSAALGLSYDTNVILAPAIGAVGAESILGVSQQSDGEVRLRAGGLVVPWQSGSSAVSLAYDFFQSYHFKLVEFDLQDHAVTAQAGSENGPVRYGLLGRYDYSLLDTQSFLQAATASPWLTIRTGNVGHLSLYYRMIWSDYKQIDFAVRDSFNHAFGATEFFELGSPEWVLSLGYQFDLEDPDIDQALVDAGAFTADQAESFAYNGNEVSVGALWPLPLEIGGEARFAYRYDSYSAQSALYTPSGTRRRDNEFLVSLALRRQIWDNLAVVLAYLGDFNDSNDPPFNYNRSIVTLGVEARY